MTARALQMGRGSKQQSSNPPRALEHVTGFQKHKSTLGFERSAHRGSERAVDCLDTAVESSAVIDSHPSVSLPNITTTVDESALSRIMVSVLDYLPSSRTLSFACSSLSWRFLRPGGDDDQKTCADRSASWFWWSTGFCLVTVSQRTPVFLEQFSRAQEPPSNELSQQGCNRR